MSKRKYILTNHKKEVYAKDRRIVLHRIKAERDFDVFILYLGKIQVKHIKKGQYGGWVESERNLSHLGMAWVDDDAMVIENAYVGGDAWVGGLARICDNTRVYGDAKITDHAELAGTISVYGHVKIMGMTKLRGNMIVKEHAVIKSANIAGNEIEIFDYTVIEHTTVFLESSRPRKR